MKGKPLLLLLTIFLLPGLAARAASPPQQQEEDASNDRVVLEEIVARVNNDIITLSELERNRRLLRQELRQQYTGRELEKQYEEQARHLLRDLIDERLLVQRAADLGISVEAEVIKRLDKMRRDAGIDTMEDFERAVATRGMTMDDLRKRLREQLLTRMVIQREVAGRVMVDSEEIRRYYEQHKEDLARPESVHLREILVSTEGYYGQERDQRVERVREILKKIRQGDDFAELAREYSDAPTAEDGGDLGLFELDKLAPGIREVVTKLNEKGVSDPFETREGYLILKLEEYIPEGVPSFEDVKNRLAEKLYFDEVSPALRQYLSDMRREAYVHVKPGYVDTGAVPADSEPVARGPGRPPERAPQDD